MAVASSCSSLLSQLAVQLVAQLAGLSGPEDLSTREFVFTLRAMEPGSAAS